MADRSIRDVLDHLGLVVSNTKELAASNVTKVRYRVGPEPLRWLSDRVSAKWSSTPGLPGYRGLSVWGIDGTHVRVPDSDENFAHFGKPGGRGCPNDAGYPQVRLAAFMNLSNRLLSGASMAPWPSSEHELAAELWKRAPSDSLIIMDRGYTSCEAFVECVSGKTDIL